MCICFCKNESLLKIPNLNNYLINHYPANMENMVSS